MVVDMAAKKQARSARMDAKKAAIAEQNAPLTDAVPAPVEEKNETPVEKKTKKAKKAE